MKNKPVIIILSLALVGLMIAVFTITAIQNRQSTQNRATATLSPTPTPQFVDPARAAAQLTAAERSHINTVTRIDHDRLNASQRERLERFKSSLPYRSVSFDVEFAPVLNKYVIYMKNSGTTAEINTYLTNQSVSDIYVGGSAVFVLSKKPVDETVADIIEALAEDSDHDDARSGNVQGAVHAQDPAPNTNPAIGDAPTEEDFTNMMDIFKMATTLMGGGPVDDGGGAPVPGGGGGPGGVANDPEFIKRAGAPNEMGYYNMPAAVNGEYEFDKPQCPGYHYGSIELLSLINKVAFDWKAKYTGSVLRIWDINSDGPHASHKVGVDVDIDVTDLSAANMCSEFYSQPGSCGEGLSEGQCRSIELGKMFLSTNIVSMMFFDDPEVNARITEWARANGKDNFQIIEPWGNQACDAGHHDHIHVRVLDDFAKERFTPGCD